MQHLMAGLGGPERYKLLSALVVPRPISFVTTVNEQGIVNAAPYSFFNVFSEDPPLVVIGIGRRSDGTLKDTALNIEANGEFVVNLVDEGIAHAMNVAATDFPPDQSEIDHADLDLVPSALVAPPRIRQAPAALECRNHTTLLVATDRRLVVGEVLAVHTQDGLVDPATLRLDLDAYKPVGRLFANLYCRTRDTFELVRMSYADWLRQNKGR
jgi:flavin reductase (DIM6/NTAB) family NADH-FMN oxidoreductase RutF